MITFIFPSGPAIAFGVTVTAIVLEFLQIKQSSIDMALSINFIMTPDIEQDDLFFGNHQGERDPIPVGKADRLAAF
jgi:hypothetical protein